ncbi:MAG: GNAT family N-acetyltransferase [Anaerolineaceae bacterium]|nr:GNAT family N-acetyltransferase [Anaerolineaceae bacterium]
MTQKHVFDFKEFPALETDRLKLRDMLPSDVTALLRHFGNPEVVRFIDMQPIKTIDQANEWLRWMGGFFAARDGLRWGIILKGDDCFIGSAGLHNWNQEANYAKIGVDIAPPYWNKGYATEALSAVVQFGWDKMNLNRIEADIVKGNRASMRVLEKVGFKQEGILRQRLRKGGKYYDVYKFSLLRSDLVQS